MLGNLKAYLPFLIFVSEVMGKLFSVSALTICIFLKNW